MIIDTHCHLDDARFRENVDEVIARAKAHGVGGFLIAGASIHDLERAKELSHRYEGVYYSVGVHPYHIDEFDEEIFHHYLQDEKCIAVGECGLDYYRLEEDKERIKAEQKEVFIAQINIAKRYNRPLIVHIRDASFDSKTILQEHAQGVKGVLHCFNASEMLLDLSENFYYGIGGVLTFKNAKKLVEVLPKIPKERLLLETDTPYLTPHPHRGKTNEPFYTTLVAQKMAELLESSYEEISNLTTNNTKRLFKEFVSLV